jgi:hypothetical protein
VARCAAAPLRCRAVRQEVTYQTKPQRRVKGAEEPPDRGSFKFCGHGRLAACRRALELSLKKALGQKATGTHPADAVCKAGDQPCLDDVRFRPLGGVTQP